MCIHLFWQFQSFMNFYLPRKKFQLNKPTFLIFILALLTRILFNIFYVGIDDVPVADALDYHQIALNLLNNGTYSSITRAPMMPFLITILYKFFGVHYFIVRIVLSIISAFTCVIVYKIARKVFDEQTALIAAFISSIYWMMFFWSGFLLTETLCTFFLTLAVLYLTKSVRHPSVRHFIYSGVSLGCSALAHALIFPFFLFIPLWSCISYKNNSKLALKSCSIILASMFLTILPWVVRNYTVTGKFIPITTHSGGTFLGSNNPEVLKHFKGGWIHPVKSGLLNENEINTYMNHLSPEDASILCWKKGINFVLKNPLFTLKLMFYKFKLFWHLNTDIRFPSLEYFFVLSFAIYGAAILIKNPANVSILYLLPLFFTLMSLVFWGDDRIRSPLEPVLVIFSAYGISTILKKETNDGKTIL